MSQVPNLPGSTTGGAKKAEVTFVGHLSMIVPRFSGIRRDNQNHGEHLKTEAIF